MHMKYNPAWLTTHPSIPCGYPRQKWSSRVGQWNLRIYTRPAPDLEKYYWKHLRVHQHWRNDQWLGSPLYHHCRCSRGSGWRCLLRCCAESPQGCWAVSVAPHSHWNDLQEGLWNNHCDHRKMPGEEWKTNALTSCSLHQTQGHYQPAVRAAQRYFRSSDSVTLIFPTFWRCISNIFLDLILSMPTLRITNTNGKLKRFETSMALGQDLELRLDIKVHSYCCSPADQTFLSPDSRLVSQQQQILQLWML